MAINRGLKALFETEDIVVAPGAYDVFSAKIIEKQGFKAVYMTGNGQSASRLGLPDLGFITMTEMMEQAINTVQAINIPVITDIDTGYGSVLNLRRTVSEFERIGVAAIQVEDQINPKKCGHEMGRETIPAEEMVRLIENITDIRQDPNFLIICRTDALTTQGLDEAIRRGKMFEEAGADVVFIESPESVEEMKTIASSFSVPALANMVEGGRTPCLTVNELKHLGFKLVIYPISSILAAARAIEMQLETLRETGTTASFQSNMLSLQSYHQLLDFSKYQSLIEGPSD
jgi:carboxyvinyl-carboxyphosphonate phosphorylmutase